MKVSDWNAMYPEDSQPEWCSCTSYDLAMVGCGCEPPPADCEGKDSDQLTHVLNTLQKLTLDALDVDDINDIPF